MLILTAAVALAGDWLKRTEARRRTGLPGYDYRGSPASNPVSEVSFISIPLSYEKESESVRCKIFQLSKEHLQHDHCRLSHVVLTIFENGNWKLSFRAEQNPSFVEELRRPEFERFDRNRFCIAVHGEGAFEVLEEPGLEVTGKPQLFDIWLQPLIVEKRQERRLNYKGTSDDVREYFSLIDRIEVELRYQ